MNPKKSNKKNEEIFDIDSQIENHIEDSSLKSGIPKEKDESKYTEELTKDELAKLQLELEEKEKELQKIHNQYLRALADYDNLHKRTTKERNDYYFYANESLITKLLEIADTFQRASADFEENSNLKLDSVLEGFRVVKDQFISVLKNEGVEKIKAKGEKFDPHFHEVILVHNDEKLEENTIIKEVQTGYLFKSKVIRPTKVIISKK